MASSEPSRAVRTIHQMEMPATKEPATSQAEVMTCAYSLRYTPEVMSCMKPLTPSSSARPVSGLKRAPTGCCIHALAARIQAAENMVPRATHQIVSRCMPLERRPQPKIHRPRKVDSRKKARRASTARGAPKMSPTKREYSDQFMPNWNSCTIPVATPSAKLMRRSLPKKRVACSQYSLPVRCHAVCMMATSRDRPIVSGTRTKW